MPYGLPTINDDDQPFEKTWGIPEAPPKSISSFKPVPQPEPTGLAPKIDAGAAPPNLSQFGSPAPKSILGTDVAPGEQISDKQMPKAEHLAENPKDAEKFQAHQEHSNILKDFGERDAAIRGQIIDLTKTATDHDRPKDYFEQLGKLHSDQGAIQEQKAHYERATPWGSAGNHPGVFGKIGHVLGEIGNVAGAALAPGLTEAIPGSQLNLAEKEHSGRAEEKFGSDLATAEQRAAAATTTAGAHKETADVKAEVDPRKAAVAERNQDMKENTLPNQISGEAFGSITSDPNLTSDQKIQKLTDLMKQEKAASKPVSLQDKTGMDGHGQPARAIFNPDPAAPNGGHYAHLDGSPFPDFKPSPNQTTNPQVPVFLPGPTPGSAQLREIHPGQSFDATNAINPSQLTATNKGVTAEQGAMGSIKGYQQDFQQNRPHLTPADLESLKVLTSHVQTGIAQQLFQDAGSGVLDALVGQPFTNYTQKLMQATMTSDQYAQMSKPAQQMLFGYTHAIVGNFVNMKQKLGSIGRNPDMIQAEMANVPLPYIDPGAADQAFTRTFRDAQGTTFNPFGQGGGNQPGGNTPSAPSGRRVINLTQ